MCANRKLSNHGSDHNYALTNIETSHHEWKFLLNCDRKWNNLPKKFFSRKILIRVVFFLCMRTQLRYYEQVFRLMLLTKEEILWKFSQAQLTTATTVFPVWLSWRKFSSVRGFWCRKHFLIDLSFIPPTPCCLSTCLSVFLGINESVHFVCTAISIPAFLVC